MKALDEARRLYTEIYRIADWPENFRVFDSVGDLVSRTDALFEQGDYEAALRLLKAAARDSVP